MSFKATNFDFLKDSLNKNNLDLKFISNEEAIIFFPSSLQHRSIKAHGLSYEDDYKGNAVAGIVNGKQVEIRFHAAFSDNRILNLWTLILVTAQKADLNLTDFTLHYQGRKLK